MAASFERTEEQDGFHHSVDVADLTITDSIPGGGAACEDPRGTDAADMVSAAEISSVADVPGQSQQPPLLRRRAPHEESMKNKDTIQDQGSSLIPTGVGEVPMAPTAAAATPTGEPEVPTLVSMKNNGREAASWLNPAGVNRVALECQPGTRPHAAASLLLTMFLTVCLRCAQRPLRATVRRVPRSPRRQRTPSSPTITTATKNSDAAAARRAHGAQRSSTPDRVSLVIQTTQEPSCGAGGAPERLWEAALPWSGPMWAM